MKKILLGVLLGIGGLALAQSIQRSLDLRVNGSASGKAYVIGGQSYVPVGALKPFGITATQQGNTLSLGAQGGANQLAALEGCIGETLFNGVMRLKVLEVVRLESVTGWENFKGWAVRAEVRNATSVRIAPGDLGVVAASIFYQDGSSRPHDDTGVTIRDFGTLTNNELMPGAPFTHAFKFTDPSSAVDAPPNKFILQVDTKRLQAKAKAKFSGNDPSFRVKLDCQK
jgi:hypothetical protein